jgi:hypothetical protein
MIDYRRYYLLQDWPSWMRGLLVIAVTVVLIILLLLFLPDASGEVKQDSILSGKYEARFVELEKEATDEAYREQIIRLYGIWLRDETGQPHRALTGARQARSAYARIMDALEKRERELRR